MSQHDQNYILIQLDLKLPLFFFISGKLDSGKDYLPAVNDDAEYENLDELSTEEIAALTERGPLTPLMLPMMLMNKKNIMLMLLANKIMMALG